MKKKLLIIGLPILLIGGGAGAYMTGQLDPLLGVEAEPEAAVAELETQLIATEFIEIKDLGMSVIRDGTLFEVVYLDLSLEVAPGVTPLVMHHWPRLLDRIQFALRELFSYRTRRGMPAIDVVEMKAVILELSRGMFGQEAIVDAHLMSDWTTLPAT